MLRDAQLGKELVITVVNKIGILADISKILADRGLNILAVAGYAEEGASGAAKIMLACDDNQRAEDALKKAGYTNIKESEVVVVGLENKPGALKYIGAQLALAGVDIQYIYGTACTEGCPAKIVLKTSNNEKALLAFKK